LNEAFLLEIKMHINKFCCDKCKCDIEIEKLYLLNSLDSLNRNIIIKLLKNDPKMHYIGFIHLCENCVLDLLNIIRNYMNMDSLPKI
jgi:hypothetical protein